MNPKNLLSAVCILIINYQLSIINCSAQGAWTQKANYGGTGRFQAAGFSIGTKGYIGTGWDNNFKQDFWEWDQASNTWTQKADFGGTAREYATGFSIGAKGYIGTGYGGATYLQDFWEWDQASDTWTQKANFGGTARKHAASFSIGTKGYIGTGDDGIKKQDFWEWDQATNAWSQKANFGGTARLYAVSFSIGTKGYIGTGDDGTYKNDLWEYSPPCNLSLNTTTTNSSCGQATGTASVTVTNGTSPYTYQWTNGDSTALADTLSAGLYMVYVTDAVGCTEQAAVMINDIGSPTITVTSVTNVTCNGGSNGAIAINVTGGSSPYTYYWMNGATTQTIIGIQAGPHQIQVTDASGCMVNKIILVNEPSPISHSISKTNASCGGNNGTATDTASGGTGPYSYAWSASPVQNTQTATGLSAGGYFVLVTDANGCASASSANIVSFGAPSAVTDSVTPATCGGALGSIYITPVGGAGPPYTFLWSTGATTEDLIGVPAGNYGLTIQGGTNPCLGAFSGTLPYKTPYTPVICIVTVDTATGKNQCAFTKDSILNLGLKQYNFYRETTLSGVYQKLGSKPANQLSLWTDQSANPLQRAWRYKITSEDSCGNEAVISGVHKTIHLAANLGLNSTVNLTWDNYEGFNYGTYVIYRYTPSTGWDSLDAVPGNPTITYNSYTDLSPPAFINLFYFIEVQHPVGCTSTLKNPQPMATTINGSMSNTYKIGSAPTSESEISLDNSVTIFPNPNSGEFRVSSSTFQVALEVYNVYGGKVHSEIVRSASYIIHCTLSNGIYFAHIKTEKGTVVKKIVIAN